VFLCSIDQESVRGHAGTDEPVTGEDGHKKTDTYGWYAGMALAAKERA